MTLAMLCPIRLWFEPDAVGSRSRLMAILPAPTPSVFVCATFDGLIVKFTRITSIAGAGVYEASRDWRFSSAHQATSPVPLLQLAGPFPGAFSQ